MTTPVGPDRPWRRAQAWLARRTHIFPLVVLSVSLVGTVLVTGHVSALMSGYEEASSTPRAELPPEVAFRFADTFARTTTPAQPPEGFRGSTGQDSR